MILFRAFWMPGKVPTGGGLSHGSLPFIADRIPVQSVIDNWPRGLLPSRFQDAECRP
ncbi:hypothetical protein CHELA20_51353 [Hyphomicrobiales bacterium]|nr:hypothetical protein CHELA41_23661 [Hyphomicrobiales bacterium]CAH1675461.1 hypothetical protein CHELA20_51353 [Hyphomicrobiales bacterium]